MGFGSWEVWAVDLVVLSGVLLALLYTYFHKNYTYWEKQHIPYLKPKFPFGNMADSFLMRKGIGEAWVSKSIDNTNILLLVVGDFRAVLPWSSGLGSGCFAQNFVRHLQRWR